MTRGAFARFLSIQLHWQAVNGGLEHIRSAEVTDTFGERLAGWRSAGECNGLHAYARDGVALCWLRWDDAWRVLVASASADRLTGLAAELGVDWGHDA